eukprot:CAMPEP_0172903734 /NCGR_PEP_ID=MMETSP1075-20121228/171214_1 /TAXON_ID=2916 /ORGANISM="Ceratium fusus, Strain PA161109" /LENGTH=62 /DNA_ID=CAMNT_0013760625 /DNA_START=480 /DNA_END=669 /DNA_ORIENTATION=-
MTHGRAISLAMHRLELAENPAHMAAVILGALLQLKLFKLVAKLGQKYYKCVVKFRHGNLADA